MDTGQQREAYLLTQENWILIDCRHGDTSHGNAEGVHHVYI